MEVLTPGSNERTTEASAEPAAAGAEQSSAMTPGAQPSESGGERGAPDLVIWATAISLLVISVIVPAVSGGRLLWLLPAVMVPLIAAWMVVQWAMVARPDRLQVRGRVPVATIIISTAIAVGVFCTVIALAFQGHG
jgi:hypothetical protein